MVHLLGPSRKRSFTVSTGKLLMMSIHHFAKKKEISHQSKRGQIPTRKSAFAFDIDGVLKAGEHVLPQARRALAMLEGKNAKNAKIPYIFITNGGGPSETERAKKLSKEFELDIKPDQVIQAHTVLQSLTKRFADLPVLMIGGPDRPPGASRKVMEDYGFNNVYTSHDIHAWQQSSWPFSRPSKDQESSIRKGDFSKVHFAAVLVFHDSRDWGRDLQYICDVLRSPDGRIGVVGDDTHEQPFLAFSHGDLIWGNDFTAPRFGQGAFQEAVKAVYEVTSGRPLEAVTFGKPQRLTYEYADALLRERMSLKDENTQADGEMSVWMIGDNPASDIAGANGFGWKSALVRTGVYRDQDGPPKHKPTILVDDVEEAVRKAIEEDWQR
ncbi:HAD-superfamily hydrolase [Meira miltonrushii]|uniref:HAD-superfamily hydrolase n=1 Tax=Meira miltonrushii TaxID=1280837 RepID=A0A316VIJ0_9BASI|nr:HAD-superfamily hydrolase [Meira miltonrushii]PWN36143.1 HAD-superfamily hydrolase [Meira miltonrushii]